jgi:hypothetical protein
MKKLVEKYRDNLVGGPTIVYQERDKTRIRGGKYVSYSWI